MARRNSTIERKPVRAATGQVIGETRGDTLIKRVRASRHKMRTPPGWAVDSAAFMQARANGVKRIEIHDKESGNKFWCDIETFRRHALTRNYPGHGAQLLLTDEYWQVLDATGERQLALWQM